MFSVTAPVLVFLVMSLKPFSERTGPLKVVLAMEVSCRGKCHSPHANVRIRVFYTEKERAANAALGRSKDLLGSGRAKHATPIGNTETVTLTRLEAHVASVEVAFHCSLNGATVEQLKAVRSIGLNKERVRIGQEVVHHSTVRDHTHRLHCVGV